MLTTASLRKVFPNTLFSKPKDMVGGFVSAELLPDKLPELFVVGLLRLSRCFQEAANDLAVSLVFDTDYAGFRD